VTASCRSQPIGLNSFAEEPIRVRHGPDKLGSLNLKQTKARVRLEEKQEMLTRISCFPAFIYPKGTADYDQAHYCDNKAGTANP
jgi:hypothetical protein